MTIFLYTHDFFSLWVTFPVWETYSYDQAVLKRPVDHAKSMETGLSNIYKVTTVCFPDNDCVS